MVGILIVMLACFMVLFAFGAAKVSKQYDEESDRLAPWRNELES